MAKELVVKREPKDADVHAQVEKEVLIFGPDGTARLIVEPGPHGLVYFLVAEPGTEFKVSITAPPEAVWSRPRPHRIPGDGITIGTKKFKVSP